MSSPISSKTLWIVTGIAWLGLALTGWWLLGHREELGARIAWHYDWTGHPDTWRQNTPEALLVPVVTGAFAVGIVAIVARFTLRSTTAPSNSVVQRTLLVTQVLITAVSILAALAPVLGARPTIVVACLSVPIALIAAVLATQKFEPPPPPNTDDAHWRGGLFYVNRDDASVWVPKRSGLGYTLNFAHPIAWVVMGLILLFPIVLIGVQFLRR